jgi:IPT/TIG domain
MYLLSSHSFLYDLPLFFNNQDMGNVEVVVGRQQSTSTQFLGYEPPTLTALSPLNYPTDDISVTGTNFVPLGVPLAGTNIVTVGNDEVLVGDVMWLDEGHINFILPAGIGKDVEVSVVIGSQASNNKLLFNYSGISTLPPPPEYSNSISNLFTLIKSTCCNKNHAGSWAHKWQHL